MPKPRVAGPRRGPGPGAPPRSSPIAAASGRGSCATSSGSNASLPAGTGVWVVKTVEARTSSSASARSAWPSAMQRPQALERQERRVALVHVEDRRREADRGQRAHAADAQQDLLPDARLAVAAVERAGDRRGPRAELPSTSVSSRSSGTRPTCDAPDLQPAPVSPAERRPRTRRRPPGLRARARRPCRPSRWPGSARLPAVGRERLAEVALLVQQAHADQRHAEIARPTSGGRRPGCRGRRSRWAGRVQAELAARSRRSGRRPRPGARRRTSS